MIVCANRKKKINPLTILLHNWKYNIKKNTTQTGFLFTKNHF